MTVRLEDIRGLWKRRFIRSAAGTDEATAVYWMQGESLFADVRIPQEAQDRAAGTDALLRCEGFAGTTSVADSVCTWSREMNFRGPPEGADVGRLRFEEGALYEDGVHADYVERWERVGSAGEAVNSARLALEDGRRGIVVWTPAHFVYAHGSADPRLASKTLAALVAEAGDDAARRRDLLRSGEYGFGERRDGTWTIALSTDPARVGTPYREAPDGEADGTATALARSFDAGDGALCGA